MEHLDKLIKVRPLDPDKPDGDLLITLNITEVIPPSTNPHHKRRVEENNIDLTKAHRHIKDIILGPVIKELINASREIHDLALNPLPHPSEYSKVMSRLMDTITSKPTIRLHSELRTLPLSKRP